ncbi:MAG: CdaR family protein [Proteobacteria bacterium]|nr:CdaR family protein [Pseudomonadota bacterium]
MSNRHRSPIQRLFSNWPYKLLAILISCTIWYVVQGEEILEVTRRLDLAFDVPQGLALRDGRSASRDITLRGPRVAISEFSSKPILALIKIPPNKKGAQRYRIDKELIANWDNRIKLTVHDPYITIFVDDRASRSVPVKVSMIGNPKRGITIKEISAEPSEITITGLKTDVQKLQEISTEVVDIGGLSEGKSIPVPLSLSGLPDFDLSVQQVVVKISIFEGTITKAFDAIQIDTLGSDKPVNVLPQHVSVVLQGTAEAIEKVSAKDIVATIDAKDLGPGRYEKEVIVRAGNDVFVSSVVPKRVTIEIVGSKKSKF